MTSSVRTTSAWARFWERGGWWRAIVLAVAYIVLYNVFSLAFLPLAEHTAEGSAAAILVGYILPLTVGGALLVGFSLSLGWLRPLFARQPITGRGWMWIAVIVVLAFNVLHLLTIDYAANGFEIVATWLLAGLFIGFAEELLTRGLVIRLLRNAGYREITVALVSSAVFAGLHASNLLTGQPLFATAFQLVYTFAFGLCMYLALRVTGNLIWPILLHASTDPTIFLSTAHSVDSPLTAIGGLGNFAVIAAALVLVWFIRDDRAGAPGLPVDVRQG
ncbi:membrane protease YdiL (CAAX protease family) [Mycetocola sp. BIGb0189]|uniref:CPBP family intramembrane glutamic endopeptidase n=1 Tax=Mycetocola sp. BIGb0189 TaxID=2940604 RepID=UPI00216A23C1|nr:CPBP family intramembrane glutamic endopeptidase [Mycetocola sp. BIGb0189]MCS4275932.1 membrane protease YdiL (CAAX protease family) [Mycetocola sp. BIGb0189]